MLGCWQNQGGRGHWTVYYPSPQSFIITFSYSFAYKLWGLFFYKILISWVIKCSVQTFQPPIVTYIIGYFVYHHWVRTLIYGPLSYPFRSLCQNTVYKNGNIVIQNCITNLKYVRMLKFIIFFTMALKPINSQ